MVHLRLEFEDEGQMAKVLQKMKNEGFFRSDVYYCQPSFQESLSGEYLTAKSYVLRQSGKPVAYS